MCKRKSTGRPSVTEEQVEQVRQAFVWNPRKSTLRGSRELGIPQPTVWCILRKRLKLKPYHIMLLQKLLPDEHHWRMTFCNELQALMEDDGFFERLSFSDESTFHLCGKVNRHNVRIWGTENPKCVAEVERDSPIVNVFCTVSTFKVYGSFFFLEQTVTGTAFLDILTERLLPQLNEDSADFIFQMDGAPPHFHWHVREFLNKYLPQRWIGCGTDDDQMLLAWPPCSPDATPCDFFLWGYVKDQVYVPPLPASIPELKVQITTAVQTVTTDMLQIVWNELDYRVDVCNHKGCTYRAPGRYVTNLECCSIK